MANPLMGFLGGNQQPPQNNNFFGMVQKFQEFKRNFKGDPRQQVQDLLNTGKMTQEQLEQCSNMARQFQQFLK